MIAVKSNGGAMQLKNLNDNRSRWRIQMNFQMLFSWLPKTVLDDAIIKSTQPWEHFFNRVFVKCLFFFSLSIWWFYGTQHVGLSGFPFNLLNENSQPRCLLSSCFENLTSSSHKTKVIKTYFRCETQQIFIYFRQVCRWEAGFPSNYTSFRHSSGTSSSQWWFRLPGCPITMGRNRLLRVTIEIKFHDAWRSQEPTFVGLSVIEQGFVNE